MTLRINQLAKDLGVSNHDVLDVLEKRMGVTGKSHSSNLSQDQEAQIRRVLEAKAKGQPEVAPLAVHKPHAAIKVVKATREATPEAPKAPEASKAPEAPKVDVPKAEPVKAEAPKLVEAPKPEAPKAPEAPKVEAPKPPVLIKKAEAPVAPAPAPTSAPEVAPQGAVPAQDESFSRLRVSQAPAQAPKPEEKPARYIQLPQARPAQAASGPRPEAGARAVLQRPGTHTTPSHVQRSGVPQPKAVLPMASNTGRGEVKHEAPKPPVTSSRMSALPSISQLQPDQGFSRLKMSDTPPPEPREQQPARYIQLPQARPAGGPSRGPGGPGGRGPGGPGRGPGGPGGPRPGGFGGPRPGGPGGPNRGPGGPRPGGFGSRPGGPGGRPGLGAPAGPIDPNSQKGPGRGPSGGKKKGKHERTEEEELAIKMRQPRSRAQVIATEYVEDEIGIVMLSEGVTVKELAEKCNRPAKDVVAKLLHRGIFATINQPLDTELAKEIAREFGFLADIVSFEEDVQMTDEATEVQGEKRARPPVVTIMGHVDHGKTSLLDAIRNAKVAAGEAGGITQHIGAYHVDVKDKNTGQMRQVVFLDTPGHEAFTKMRARGAKVTDIAILVVAADDGVMPQTVESINHAKAADVPLVVAINKIDKPGANPDKVQQGLLQHGVQTEAYGGDVPGVPVSAKQKLGLDELLETLLLVADLKDLKAVYDCPAAGSIIEARLDKGRGAVATVLVQNGTLKQGEIFVAGATMGRVRAMFDDRGERITEAGPSTAVQILGFEAVPSSGDNFQVVESEGKARTIVQFRQEKLKAAALAKQRVTLENIFSTMKEGTIKELPLIIKADTQGSV
ncbi:MAG TPA: translation initiation factor IF-2, partial [Holophagaceae bacterium]|nr:translation initiation factor IF-2 [Holophagaceae bacterium]